MPSICPRPTPRRPRRRSPRAPRCLNRFNCDGCHVLEMPKFTIPKGAKVAEAFPNFKGNLRSSYTARNNDYLAELYPGLTFDPKKKLDPNEIEKELGIGQDDGKPITIEGMPIGLFENELTVQLWQPVTIRGYTFNVATTSRSTRPGSSKTPAVGGDFAVPLRDLPGRADGPAARHVLEPAAAAPAA